MQIPDNVAVDLSERFRQIAITKAEMQNYNERVWTADDLSEIARLSLSLFHSIRDAKICVEGGEYAYFNVIGRALETSEGAPDAAALARNLAELRNEPIEFLDLSSLQARVGRRICDTPEEDYILYNLTQNYIHETSSYMHFIDGELREPRAMKVIASIDGKLRQQNTLCDQMDVLLARTSDFIELHDAYVAVAQKHGLDFVNSANDWKAGLSLDEVGDTKRNPISLSQSLEVSSLGIRLGQIMWELQATAEPDAAPKFEEFLSLIPAAWFVDVRQDYAELKGFSIERDHFEAWVRDCSKDGIFRTEIIAEIERRWGNDYTLRGIGRATLDRLENLGIISRKKVSGRLHFTLSSN